MKLVASVAVLGARLLFQGGEPVRQTRVVQRCSSPATRSATTTRVRPAPDVLSIVGLLRKERRARRARIGCRCRLGQRRADRRRPRAWPGQAIDQAAIGPARLCFGCSITAIRCSFRRAKYLDLPGMSAQLPPATSGLPARAMSRKSLPRPIVLTRIENLTAAGDAGSRNRGVAGC